MQPEQFRLYQIQNAYISAIIYFHMPDPARSIRINKKNIPIVEVENCNKLM